MAGTDDFLVWVERTSGPQPGNLVDEVIARLGIAATDVYRTWNTGFGARLEPARAAGLTADADVRRVVADEPGRPAPYWPSTAPNHIPGSYLVLMEEGTDPATLTRRLAISPTGLFRFALTGFAADLTDEQLDLARRSPGVREVIDDAVHTL